MRIIRLDQRCDRTCRTFIFLCITDGFSIGKGDIYVFLGAIAFSIHILVIDYFTQFNDGVKMSCIMFFICGILCFVPMMLFEHPEISMILLAWKPILYAGVMSCGVAYTLQIVGQKNMNPTVASLILSLGICDLCDRWIFGTASKLKPERVDRMCIDVYSDYSGAAS